MPDLVSDAERYQLALQAGFTGQNAVTATAISIAENGSGNPALPSGKNNNGSFDLGLWQINSSWFPQFGGQQALTDPLTNAKAAFAIFSQHGGFNNWCTYWPTGCGGANANKPNVQAIWESALARAQAVAGGGGTDSSVITENPINTPGFSTTPSTTGDIAPGTPTKLNLGFNDTIQHTVAQTLLLIFGIAILLGGIYLIGSGKV